MTDTDRAALLAAVLPKDLEAMLVYLDELRDSGIVNMFGARPYLAEAFGIPTRSAGAVLAHWMETFAARHPVGA
jgi:hypothetical protein